MKRLNLIFLALWGGGALAQGVNQTIFPSGFENVEGNDAADLFRVQSEFQQLFRGTQFSLAWQTPVEIQGVSFRANAASSGSFSAVIPTVELRFSTSGRAPEQMSTSYSLNRGADETVVFLHNNVNVTAHPSLPTSPFEIQFTFDQPFYYDPRNGNLLMYIKVSGSGEYFRGGVDAQSYGTLDSSRPVSWVEPFGIPPTPTVRGSGVITEFSWVSVPEPTPAFLILSGIVSFVWVRKRRLKSL